MVVGQNPGTNHPRMLIAAGEGQGQRREDHRGEPAAGGGADAVQEPAERARACVGRGSPSPTSSCRSRLGGDLALFQAIGHAAAGGGRRRRHVVDRIHRHEHRGLRGLRGAHRAQSTGTRARRDRPRPRADRPGGRDVRRLRAHHRLLGDGPHAAQARRADDPRGRERAAPARHDRQARRRPVPGARPLATCRATAPWASARRCRRRSCRAGDEFGSSPAAKHGFDTVDAIRAMRDGRGKVFIAHGRQLRHRHAGHRGDRAGAAQLLADRAGLDEAQPLARRARPRRR